MEIIFCDNHILVAVKPARIATQPDFVDMAKAWIKHEFKKAGNVFLEPIHRLDKPVSGLVLFARTSKALSRLQAEMRERRIKKTYFALVEGAPPSIEGELKHYLLHGDHRAEISSAKNKEAKEAILNYRSIAVKDTCTLVQINLQTGRYHQIRAQMSAVGCPVKGDRKYGAHSESEAILLHAGELEFIHPVTREAKKFVSKGTF